MIRNTSVSNEFFFYDACLESAGKDFTGDDTVTAGQRKEFLQHYAGFLENCYEISTAPQKVVTQEELKRTAERLQEKNAGPLISGHMDLTTMSACLKRVYSGYEGWSFYTAKTEVDGDTLVFLDEELPPAPSAVFSFSGEKRLTELAFSFYMDGKYDAAIPGGILDTTPGRTVELRCGIHDVLKLQFYADGTCCARLGNRCPYHPENVVIGHFAFDRWQRVKLLLTDNSFTVSLNDTVTEELPLSCNENPDMLYIGCGMFQVGEWRFRPLSIKLGEQMLHEFFHRTDKTEAWPEEPGEYLGEVRLPFRTGGFANRDKAIILEKEFSYDGTATVVLTVEALDPGGRVYINGSLAADTDSFETLRLEITSFLTQGTNLLKLVVYPRAPEVLFGWHRQEDPYNGWFCEGVSLQFFHQIQVRRPEVITLSVGGGQVRCRMTAETSQDCEIRAFIRKIFPSEEAEERLIGVGWSRKGRFELETEFTADSWSPETPRLYSVRLAAIKNGEEVDDAVVETGFRTISQENGRLWLNGKTIVLTGALLMQFLPPHRETSITHICPDTEQILWQEMMLKRMNGNTMRMHILGYGTNDRRYAALADRLGLLLIWTTRYIDSVEQMMWQETWKAGKGYQQQIKERINHPSIIMWEGANEYHPSLRDIDRIYKSFVPMVKEADPSRLICPVSHLYYAGDMLPLDGCACYNDEGTEDHEHHKVHASRYWTDAQVIRSAHTYEILLGYGSSWKKMRKQEWSMQKELLENRKRAYIVSEFAVIGMQDPTTPEAGEYFNEYSYEEKDDDILGFRFDREEWRESQAFQALAAKADVQVMRLKGVDGMLWCCLMGGANDAGYRKPVIDSYGYPKLAFYTLKEGYQELYVASADVDVLKGKKMNLHPVVFGAGKDKSWQVEVIVRDERGKMVDRHVYPQITGGTDPIALASWKPVLPGTGYYSIQYRISEFTDYL